MATVESLTIGNQPTIPATVQALYINPAEAVAGTSPADRFERHPEPNRLAVAVGEGLAKLHEIEVEPDQIGSARDGFASALDLIDRRLAAGAIDSESLPDPYRRYEPERLVELAKAAPAGLSDIRWCHPKPTLDQFLVANSAFVGFPAPCGARLGDRHLDLAIVQLDLAKRAGAEAVIAFYDAYGAGVDLVQLDKALLVIHLGGFWS